MVKINIIALGDIYPLDIDKLKKSTEKSKIFNIVSIQESIHSQILNKFELQINDNEFKIYFEELKNNNEVNINVIIVNRTLENNFYTRLIYDNLIVISIHDIEVLNNVDGITSEMFINRFLYAFSVIYDVYNKLDIRALDELMQNNTKGCLFDTCVLKNQITRFFRKPILCSTVKETLNTKILPKNYILDLQKEIKKLKISDYYIFINWLKLNPKTSIILGGLATIPINYLSDILKYLFFKLICK